MSFRKNFRILCSYTVGLSADSVCLQMREIAAHWVVEIRIFFGAVVDLTPFLFY